MSFTVREFWYAAGLATSLVAVILLGMGFYHFIVVPFRKRRKAAQLLSQGEHLHRIQILKKRSEDRSDWSAVFWKKVMGSDLFNKLLTLMLQADVFANPKTLMNLVLFLSLVGFGVVFWALQEPLLGLVIALGLGILPFCYLILKRTGKSLNFEKQMPDAMEILARSLRAGHTLPSAIELLGEEMAPPMGTEMRISYEEQKYGLSVSDSLLHMLQRVDSMDLKYFVSAVTIQQETGGNLAELMENIARVVRSRLNFKAKLRALVAPARLSAIIMVIFPVIVFFAMMTVASFYEKSLIETPVGRKMLLGGIALTVFGALTLRRLIRSVQT
jgi:tight adherence protein B